MKNKRNYYRVLHVQPDAPKEIIRASYRTLMHKMRMHPDLGGDDWNAALLNEAYEVLTDPGNRAAYDKSRPGDKRYTHRERSKSLALSRMALADSQCMFCGFVHTPRESLGKQDLCERCESPLYPLKLSPAEASDRRTIGRIPNKHSIIVATHWPMVHTSIGRTENLSLNGVKFSSPENLEVGELIKIDSAVLKAVARIVRCQHNGREWVAAAAFLSLLFLRSRGSFVAERV